GGVIDVDALQRRDVTRERGRHLEDLHLDVRLALEALVECRVDPRVGARDALARRRHLMARPLARRASSIHASSYAFLAIEASVAVSAASFLRAASATDRASRGVM